MKGLSNSSLKILKSSPYVAKITDFQIVFTDQFKRLVLDNLYEGMTRREMFNHLLGVDCFDKKFVDDMSKCLENAFNMLKKNGHLALMMGDTTIGGEYVRVVYETIIASKIKKSSIKTVALRVPKYTEASWATSQRRIKKNIGITLNDFIIIFKK
jgi:hypothetical protein